MLEAIKSYNPSLHRPEGSPSGDSSSIVKRPFSAGRVPGLDSLPALKWVEQSEPDPGYVQVTENQGYLLPGILNPTVSCTPYHIVLKCDCGHRPVVSGCMKKNCNTCKTYTGLHRSKAAYHKIINYECEDENQSYKSDRLGLNKFICYTVFTLPLSLRVKYADKKKCHSLRIKIWQLLKKFGAVYGFEVTHPISEKNKDIFHPHFNFVWRQSQVFRPLLDVKRLNELYAKLLKYKTKVDVYHAFYDNLFEIKQKCNYVCRLFPECSDWTGPVRWFGDYPETRKVNEICPICNQIIIAIGTISQFTYDKYYSQSRTHCEDPPKYIPLDEIIQFGKSDQANQHAID